MGSEISWPKKATVGEYAKRWYSKPCRQTIVNRLKSGKLPGGQEYQGGPWYVWVNEDMTPAHDYQPLNTPIAAKGLSTGNELADIILNKRRAL